VDSSNIASAIGSGLADVFATPMMVALMELAAAECLTPYLEPGMSSVGTQIAVSHSSATPMGMTVTAAATVTAVAGRQVEFQMHASDDRGEIGSGSHTRFVVQTERFMEKAAAKGRK